MQDWPTMRLIDLAVPKKWALNGGPFGSKLVSKDYVESGVPVIRGGNLPDGARFSFDDLVFVSEDKADDLLANNAHPGDIIFTQRGTLGQVGIIPVDGTHRRYVISQSQMKLTVDETKANREFIYYFFRCPATVQRIKNHSLVAGVPHINLDILRNWEIPLPPLGTQRNIAVILSAYDDLIENNTRRIQILEQMARALYREWFVDFRFPGHAKVKLVDSPVGRIPQGWEVQPLETCCHLVMGQSPASEFYNERGEGLPFHQGVTDFGEHFPTDRVFCTVDNRIAEVGDVLFSVRAPVGRINVADKRIVIGRGVSAIRSRLGQQKFLLFQLKDRFKEEDTMGGGTIFKAVTKEDMQRIPLSLPPSGIVEQFESNARPMVMLLENLTNKNTTLRRTRDLLLPKLISGALDVSELDIETA